MKNHHYNYQLSTTIWLSSLWLKYHHYYYTISFSPFDLEDGLLIETTDPWPLTHSHVRMVRNLWMSMGIGHVKPGALLSFFSLTCFEIARWLLLKMLYTYPICMPIVVPEKTQSPMIWFWLSPTPGIRARSHSPPNRDLTINNWWEDWPPKKWSCTNEEKNGHVWFCLLQWYINNYNYIYT